MSNPPYNPQNPYNNPQNPQQPYNPQQPQQYGNQQNWQQGNYQQQQFPPPPNFQQPVFPPYNTYNPFNPTGGPMDLPGASTAQVCGIIGIILFFNIIGIILNIIAIVKGNAAIREADLYPGRYTEQSVKRAKAGRTCGIIGLCLFALFVIVLVIAISVNL